MTTSSYSISTLPTKTSLMIQWLGLRLPMQRVRVGSLVEELKSQIPQASPPKNQNIKQKQYCNEFNKELKNSPHQKAFKK